MTIGSKQPRYVIPFLAASALAGCAISHPMMPVPALYTGPQPRPLFADAHPDARVAPLDLLFITDRAPSQRADEREPYTAERSRSMAFGSTTILFGEGLTWDTLV